MKRLEFWFCCRELINLQKNEDIIDQNIAWLGASHFFISYTLALKRLKTILLYLSLSFVFVFAHLFPPGSVQWVSVDKAFRDQENSSKLSPQSNPQSNWGESCIWNKISNLNIYFLMMLKHSEIYFKIKQCTSWCRPWHSATFIIYIFPTLSAWCFNSPPGLPLHFGELLHSGRIIPVQSTYLNLYGN